MRQPGGCRPWRWRLDGFARSFGRLVLPLIGHEGKGPAIFFSITIIYLLNWNWHRVGGGAKQNDSFVGFSTNWKELHEVIAFISVCSTGQWLTHAFMVFWFPVAKRATLGYLPWLRRQAVRPGNLALHFPRPGSQRIAGNSRLCL